MVWTRKLFNLQQIIAEYNVNLSFSTVYKSHRWSIYLLLNIQFKIIWWNVDRAYPAYGMQYHYRKWFKNGFWMYIFFFSLKKQLVNWHMLTLLFMVNSILWFDTSSVDNLWCARTVTYPLIEWINIFEQDISFLVCLIYSFADDIDSGKLIKS